jgi:molybdenum cofactor synthesis domain-containing protein
MAVTATPTAGVIVIGNEILSGRTQDANLPWLARELNGIGIRVVEARVVADEEDAIVEAVNALRARCTYVFTTGGIGPTHDDITSAAVAKAFGLPHGRHPEAERRLLAYYEPDMVNEARLRMADTPEGATLIDNPVSAAPGFRVENVHVLPGVPKIMQAMLDGLRNTLEGGPPMLARSIVLFCPEGEAAQPLGELQARHPDVEIGSYPFFRRDRHGTTIVARGTDRQLVDAAAADLVATATALGLDTTEVPMTGSPLSEW